MSLWDLTSGRGTELAGLCWTLEPLVLRCHSDGLTRAEAAGGRQVLETCCLVGRRSHWELSLGLET